MRILGIDFGFKNIGLAYSEGEIAEPLAGFKVKTYKQLLKRLVAVCRERQISLIIIGIPEGKLEDKVKKLAFDLRKNTGLKVEFQDETLTSKQAAAKMIESGKPKLKRQKQQHIVAACLILQSYLDQKKVKVLR
jgi:putative holliday junction resolvase